MELHESILSTGMALLVPEMLYDGGLSKGGGVSLRLGRVQGSPSGLPPGQQSTLTSSFYGRATTLTTVTKARNLPCHDLAIPSRSGVAGIYQGLSKRRQSFSFQVPRRSRHCYDRLRVKSLWGPYYRCHSWL